MCITNMLRTETLGQQRLDSVDVASLLDEGHTGKELVVGPNGWVIMTHQNHSRRQGDACPFYSHSDVLDDKIASWHHNGKKKKPPSALTPKNHIRHYAEHNYRDHSKETPNGWEERKLAEGECGIAQTGTLPVNNDHVNNVHCRGGVPMPFPLKLHEMLEKIEEDGLASIVSWQPHGRSFAVHDTKEFVSTVMPKYFRQTKMTSFQRQLNLYGFSRITRGRDKGGYYHELFLRGMKFLSRRMTRTKVKGTKIKAVSSPELEPNFYVMPTIHSRPKAGLPHAPIITPDMRTMAVIGHSSEPSQILNRHESVATLSKIPEHPEGSFNDFGMVPKHCATFSNRPNTSASCTTTQTTLPYSVTSMHHFSPAPDRMKTGNPRHHESNNDDIPKDPHLTFDTAHFQSLDLSKDPVEKILGLDEGFSMVETPMPAAQAFDEEYHSPLICKTTDKENSVLVPLNFFSDNSSKGFAITTENNMHATVSTTSEMDDGLDAFLSTLDMPISDEEMRNISDDTDLGILLEKLID